MTGFAFAYAVMRVCGGQPRKNPGAPNSVYAEFFTEPYPARSAVAVKTLPKGALVEIEVIAEIG